MTLAGNNIEIRIFRINYANDDIVGGAVVTGTVVGDYPARMQANPVEQIFEQQGLETDRTFKINIVPGYLDIRERDELTVIAPTDHVYYNKWFRVRSVSYSSFNKRDPRNYMMLTVSRSVRAHSDLLIASNTTTTLYDRIMALEPTIFLPLGDATSPMSDVMGYGGSLGISGTSWSAFAYGQAGIEAGHSSLLMTSGTVGTASIIYGAAQTPNGSMSVGVYIKFVSPYLDGSVAKTIMRSARDSGGWIDITKSNAPNAIKFSLTGWVSVQSNLTQTGVDYNWHSYYWTLNFAHKRFRAYYDGVLIGENTVTLANYVSSLLAMYLGSSIATPSTGNLGAYVQYHTMWASRELTQAEITSIATV